MARANPQTTPSSSKAIAIVEARGVVALSSALEAMMKTADLELVAIDRVGGGIAFAVLSGSTAAVRVAVAAAEPAGRLHSDRFSVRMYVQPSRPSRDLIDEGRLPRSPTG